MNNKLKKMVENLIETTINDAHSYDIGSEERTMAVANLEKLIKMVNDDDKLVLEHDENDAKCSMEMQKYEKQLAEQKKDRWFKTGLEIAGITISAGYLILTNMWMTWGFDFEKTGAISSSAFKWMLQRLPGNFKKK